MRYDFTAAELFLQGQTSPAVLDEALAHPAYQAVFAHGARYGNPLSPADVHAALAGQPSGFYGLREFETNLTQIHTLLSKTPKVFLSISHDGLAFCPGNSPGVDDRLYKHFRRIT